MVNARFSEIARRPDAAFLRASSGGGRVGRDVESFTVSARVNDGGIDEGLEALALEMARLGQHGFGAAELDRAKRDVVAGYERAYNERDRAQSGSLASELLRHFLEDEAAPGIDVELDLVRRLLPAITVAEVSAFGAGIIRRGQPRRDCLVSGEGRCSRRDAGEPSRRVAGGQCRFGCRVAG